MPKQESKKQLLIHWIGSVKCAACKQSYGEYDIDALPEKEIPLMWEKTDYDSQSGTRDAPSGEECKPCAQMRKGSLKISLEAAQTAREKSTELDMKCAKIRRDNVRGEVTGKLKYEKLDVSYYVEKVDEDYVDKNREYEWQELKKWIKKKGQAKNHTSPKEQRKYAEVNVCVFVGECVGECVGGTQEPKMARQRCCWMCGWMDVCKMAPVYLCQCAFSM